MYKKIMIPVALDHTDHLGDAVAAAKALSAEGADLLLVSVIEDIPSYVRIQIPDELLKDAKADALEQLAKLAEQHSVHASCHAVHGTPGSSLVDFAGAHGIDLIVIASHRPGLADYFLGSTAARVVRHAACAVHVIR